MRSLCRRSVAAGLRALVVVLALACQPSSTPGALEDTPENRSAQIERYLQAQPPQQMLKEIVESLAARMPDAERAKFVDLMTKQVDVAKLTAAMRESMAKRFTADEIRALADFYGSDVGKSAMEKFGTYMADVMPVIQAEIMAAVGRAQTEMTPEAPAEAPESPAEAPKAPAEAPQAPAEATPTPPMT